MLIHKDHIRIIKLLEETSNIKEIWSKIDIDKHHLTRRITELMIMGLVDVIGNTAKLTKEGKMIYDAIHWIEANEGINLLERDIPRDQWINSQIINILKYYELTGDAPDEWKALLNERVLLKDNKLNQAAKLVLEAYKISRPHLYIDQNIAEFLAAIPTGPADYKILLRYKEIHGYAENTIQALEAQRLLEFSPPYKGKIVYMLTPAGMKLREYMNEIPLYYSLMYINEKVRKLLEGGKEKLTEEDKRYLERMGMYDMAENGYTNVANKLLNVYKLQTQQQKYLPPIYITKEDIMIMNFIEETWEKHKTNPEIIPDRKYVKEKVSGNTEKIGLTLYLLEARGLITMEDVKGKEALKLTEKGKVVLSYFKKIDNDITTEAVKALTFREWGEIPAYDWVAQAEKLGLIGHGDITKRGQVLLEVTKTTERKIYITNYDALIITKTPSKKTITREKLLEIINETLKKEKISEKDFEIALSEAEAKKYIIEYPNHIVKLTELGEALKTVIESAKTDVILSMKISLTPDKIEILKTIKEHEPDYAKAWSEKEVLDKKVIETIAKDLKIPVDTVKEAVTQLRGMGFLGRKAGGRILTGPAEALLKALKYLEY